MELTERQRWILKSVIDIYVTTAEPVGSRAIAEQSETPISSATVRNELAELEAAGYLEQPHTSAGRVPTDLAYREYVDHLMEPEPMPEEEKKEIRRGLDQQIYEVNDLMPRANELLSESTGYASVTLTPSEPESFVSQLKFLQIEPGRVMVIVVVCAGLVKDRIIRTSDLFTPKQLQMISGVLEENLRAVQLKDITLVTVEAAAEDIAVPDPLLNQLLYEAYVSIKQAENLDVYMDGVQRLFIQPEFNEPAKVHKVYNALQKDGLITGYLSHSDELSDNPFMIRIGQEIAIDGLEACSLVTTTYQLGERLFGKIGIIGPRRMEYEKVIPRISFIRESVKDVYKDKTEG